MTARVVIVMGSKGDLEHAGKIAAQLAAWEIPCTLRVASAHKSVRHLLAILDSYAHAAGPMVFIGVAGRSNALAGMVDANTAWPVIALSCAARPMATAHQPSSSDTCGSQPRRVRARVMSGRRWVGFLPGVLIPCVKLYRRSGLHS